MSVPSTIGIKPSVFIGSRIQVKIIKLKRIVLVSFIEMTFSLVTTIIRFVVITDVRPLTPGDKQLRSPTRTSTREETGTEGTSLG